MKIWRVLRIIIILLFIIITYKLLFLNNTLYIMSDNNTLLVRNINNSDEVHLSYNQSLYNTTQTEVFVVDKLFLKLDKVIFGDLNSLYYYDYQNLNYYIYDDKVWLVDINKSFDKIYIRANYSKTHFLEIYKNGNLYREVNISSLFDSGERLKIGMVNNFSSLFLLFRFNPLNLESFPI